MNFEKIKANYEKGTLPIRVVRFMVLARILTKDQFKNITAKEY